VFRCDVCGKLSPVGGKPRVVTRTRYREWTDDRGRVRKDVAGETRVALCTGPVSCDAELRRGVTLEALLKLYTPEPAARVPAFPTPQPPPRPAPELGTDAPLA
jgi:hypothetical protein